MRRRLGWLDWIWIGIYWVVVGIVVTRGECYPYALFILGLVGGFAARAYTVDSS